MKYFFLAIAVVNLIGFSKGYAQIANTLESINIYNQAITVATVDNIEKISK